MIDDSTRPERIQQRARRLLAFIIPALALLLADASYLLFFRPYA